MHYVVGGNTKVYGASLPRLRERDFTRVEHPDGVSPAWPFSYAELEPYYAEAERSTGARDGGRRSDGALALGPFPFAAVEHEPYVADLAERLRAQGVHPSANAMGIDLRPGGRACAARPATASRA